MWEKFIEGKKVPSMKVSVQVDRNPEPTNFRRLISTSRVNVSPIEPTHLGTAYSPTDVLRRIATKIKDSHIEVRELGEPEPTLAAGLAISNLARAFCFNLFEILSRLNARAGIVGSGYVTYSGGVESVLWVPELDLRLTLSVNREGEEPAVYITLKGKTYNWIDIEKSREQSMERNE